MVYISDLLIFCYKVLIHLEPNNEKHMGIVRYFARLVYCQVIKRI